MDELKELLRAESNFRPSEELMDYLLSETTPVCVRAKEVIIREGVVNTTIYIVKEGLLRMYYYDGDKEVTFGFVPPGTIILSPWSYYDHKASFICTESCLESVLLAISKERFDALLKGSHEFNQWMFNVSMGQLCAMEMKKALMSGSAKERYIALVKNRPEILRAVSMKILASYLGVTPQYLCNIRKSIK